MNSKVLPILAGYLKPNTKQARNSNKNPSEGLAAGNTALVTHTSALAFSSNSDWPRIGDEQNQKKETALGFTTCKMCGNIPLIIRSGLSFDIVASISASGVVACSDKKQWISKETKTEWAVVLNMTNYFTYKHNLKEKVHIFFVVAHK